MNSKTRIRVRRGTSAEWASANPLLLIGELGLDTTTRRLKAGDGATLWNDLPYLADSNALGIGDLLDTEAAAAVDGSLLIYNASTGKWEAGPATAVPEVLNGGNY